MQKHQMNYKEHLPRMRVKNMRKETERMHRTLKSASGVRTEWMLVEALRVSWSIRKRECSFLGSFSSSGKVGDSGDVREGQFLQRPVSLFQYERKLLPLQGLDRNQHWDISAPHLEVLLTELLSFLERERLTPWWLG
ncbi:uncharacterized protein G2W53_022575 [Senna tora]|uniref:Uncharacterized protein n=1 Tax=Senna tora TaxID=362788 RepID=A0A834TP24_9FABA|nr:uncharacterized protein G2W53_022575 [Senna tora]